MAQTCIGCGARLQSEDADAPGYVPASALTKEDVLCRRCYRIRHYGEFSRVALPLSTYAKEVSAVLQRPGLVLYVLDVFDLAGSMVPALHEYIGNSPVVAVVNKIDLLPKEIEPKLLRKWISDELASEGIKPVDVIFVSAEKSVGLETLQSVVAARRETRVYAVGMANVGKSSILNALMARVEGGTRFTESRVPGTTLANSQVEMRFADGKSKTIIDTPGLILNDRVTDALCIDCLKAVVPSSRLRPRIYQLQPGQTIFLGGFARFDFVQGTAQSLVFYVSNDLVVHRTKLERADEFVRLHSDDILHHPCKDCRETLGNWSRFSVEAGAGTRRPTVREELGEIRIGVRGGDIVIPGLGWVALSGLPLEGTVWTRSRVHVSVRERLIGSLNHVEPRR
ncbi:ribosome biogenesis GTPase YqeH [Alicyclobacillus ferrooxydans]|uniref:Uncharacterized protein n=1 Tax=Alicyclobacillus ferrooxydans TaxID=471514 RepID=A0A0P9E9C7_9BACL|nr:ribosome biogenesis GTPase YqeH [Alicyclobacillus ferrooxydans]KPV38980.1 hypothetical protein AN477_23470 [Alicyclobacillus ferrooxydans]